MTPTGAASTASTIAKAVRNARNAPSVTAQQSISRATTEQAYSRVASSVIVALRTLETGQFAFAVSASFWNSSFDRPGTLALSVSATAATFQPPSTCSGALPAPLN